MLMHIHKHKRTYAHMHVRKCAMRTTHLNDFACACPHRMSRKPFVHEMMEAGRTALGLACHNSDVDLFEDLIEKKGMSPNKVSASCIHYIICELYNISDAFIFKGHSDALCHCTIAETPQDLLLSLEQVDAFCEIPLHIAARSGNLEMVFICLTYDPDLNKENFEGCTPLCLALEQGHTEVAEYLIKVSTKLVWIISHQSLLVQQLCGSFRISLLVQPNLTKCRF